MLGLRKVDVGPYYDPMSRQRELQQVIGDRLPHAVVARRAAHTNAELAEVVTANVFAIQMELAELVERLNWKPWRDYSATDADPPPLDVVTESAYELIDVLHFCLNIGIVLGLTWEDVLGMYEAKQMENRARQERGY